MINSFCIGTPVPVFGSAQGHVKTRRPKADVAYCHGKTPVPGGAGMFIPARLLNGQKTLQIFDARYLNSERPRSPQINQKSQDRA
jgi:hypothetical protein